MISDLSPLTPHWLRPFCDPDLNLSRNVHKADVREITNPRSYEGSPASVGVDAARGELAVAGAKMAAFAEMKVRRCCSLLVIGGDVV